MQNKYPLRIKLLALSNSERYSAICDYIHSILITELSHTKNEILELSFSDPVADSGFSKNQLARATDTLFDKFKRDLNLHFFYFEKTIHSIDKLASIIDNNLVEIFSPPKYCAVEEPFFSNQCWPWKPSKSIKPIDKNQDKIVFVMSCPRSGSTIFRLILAAHPSLFSPPELHLLPFENMAERAEQINANGFEWMSAGIAEALTELEIDDAFGVIRTMENEKTEIIDVYRKLQSLCGDRILIDKTPFYSCHISWLQRANDLFPNAKFIFLTRHPYGMINSFVKLRIKDLTRNKFGCPSTLAWHLAEQWWRTGNENISTFSAQLSDDKALHLKYEDLISSTKTAMDRVCHFLNIPFDERVLNPYEESSEIMISGIGDPNICEHKKIDTSLADSWRNIELPHPLSPMTLTLANKLGYQCDV